MSAPELNWDDLQVLLAVARHGSTRQASAALGLSQPTVARRIQALERALGAVLAERRRTGYRLTEAGLQAARLAEPVESAVTALTASFPGHTRRTRGPLRVTTTEVFTSAFVAPAVSAVRRLDPDVTVELIASDQRLDLMRGEADLALRAGWRPRGAGLVAARLPAMAWGVYCSRSYREAHGAPARAEDLAGHALILAAGQAALIPAFRWFEQAAGAAPLVSRSHSPGAALTSVRAGLGVSVTLAALGDADPDLFACFYPPETFDDEVWLVYPAVLQHDPRLRRLADAIFQRVRATRKGRPHPQAYGIPDAPSPP